MKFEIKSRWDGSILFACEAGSLKLALELAVSKRADLKGADLKDAYLEGAYLEGADLEGIKNDFFARLTLAKAEVIGLYKAVWDGRINGSVYSGECACFAGTVAKVRGCDPDSLEKEIGLRLESSSPTEKWFLALRPGHTPENHGVAAIVADWIGEWAKANDVKLPSRRVVWE